MKKWIFVLAFLMASTPLFAEDFLAKKQVKIGEPVADFTLQDLQGKSVSLSEFKGKIVMLHFWSAKCPFVLRYTERLQKIAKIYTPKGVTVLGIDANGDETLDEIKKVTTERKDNYPILLDLDHKIADQFGAITTPHVFLIDKAGKLAYEGAVDDQGWSEDKKPKRLYTMEALNSLLTDQPIPHRQTKTAGCTIKRKG